MNKLLYAGAATAVHAGRRSESQVSVPSRTAHRAGPGRWSIRGPWLLSVEVARRPIEAGRPGRIMKIASMAAYHYAGEGAALYSVSKAAVHRMTEVLAVEWARYGINANAIAPGVFASEMTDGMLGRLGDITPAFPRRQMGAPAQLDSTLLYLVDRRPSS